MSCILVDFIFKYFANMKSEDILLQFLQFHAEEIISLASE
jgi:hypothetical protein